MALVKINLKDIFGSGFSARVVFTPLETPWIKGDWSLVTSRTTEVTTNTAGLAEATLLAGRYRVTFPRYTEDVLEIGVPDDDEEYNFALLIDAGGGNIPTPPHWQGPPGEAATITIDSTETLEPGKDATVENVGNESAAVLKFGIPKGATGDAASIAVEGVETIAPGLPAEVINVGTSTAASFVFKIPRGVDGEDGNDGEAATISVNSTTTGDPGTEASVTNTGTAQAASLAFVIPRGATGEKGDAATVEVNSVATGAAGSSASVVNSGTASAAKFDFTIPRGDKGEQGDPGEDYTRDHLALSGTVIDLSSGSDIIYYATLSGAVTYTFGGPVNGTIALIQFSNAGGHAVTWPGTVQWMTAGPPPSVLPESCMVMFTVINGVITGGWVA